MALYTSLPIYRAALDLMSVAVDYSARLPRNVRPLIGHRIADQCADIVELIFKANCAEDKVPFIGTLLERVEGLNLWLRLCRDKRFISTDQYADAVELTTSVGKQATKWKQKYAVSPVT